MRELDDIKESGERNDGLSRRGFLRGAGMMAGAVALGAATGVAGCSTQTKEASKTAPDFDLFESEVLVLGAGFGGVFAALQAHKEGANVMVVDKGPFRSSGASGFNWDTGVIVFNGVEPTDVTKAPWNAAGLTWCDTLTNQRVAHAVQEFHGNTNDSWNNALIFGRLGTAGFIRLPDGTLEDDIPGDPNNMVSGIIGVYPRNNQDYMHNLDITVVDNTVITDLFMSGDSCVGAIGVHTPTGRYRVFRAKATINATGGACQMWGWLRTAAISLNSVDNTGDVDAAAYRRGCSLINSEFFNYDLISLVPESLGASFCSGIGADSTNKGLVCDSDGEFFLTGNAVGYVPITRTVIDKVRAGKGGKHGGVFLDLTRPEAEELSRYCYYRNGELWKSEFGIDVKAPGYKVPIGVEAFEHLGNAVVDEKMMTELPGFFNVRGTGITLTLVTTHHAAPYAAHCAVEYAKNSAIDELDWAAVESELVRLEDIHSREGSIRPMKVRHSIQKAVHEALRLGADAKGLTKAIAELERIRNEDIPKMAIVNKTKCFNLEWKQAIETNNLLELAEAALRSSLMREESRGFFYRTDFPDQDDKNWLVNIYAKLDNGKMKVEKRPVVTL